MQENTKQENACIDVIKEKKKSPTSVSHVRSTPSSPPLIIVLFKGPQRAPVILPWSSGPLIVSTESLVSAMNKQKQFQHWTIAFA